MGSRVSPSSTSAKRTQQLAGAIVWEAELVHARRERSVHRKLGGAIVYEASRAELVHAGCASARSASTSAASAARRASAGPSCAAVAATWVRPYSLAPSNSLKRQGDHESLLVIRQASLVITEELPGAKLFYLEKDEPWPRPAPRTRRAPQPGPAASAPPPPSPPPPPPPAAAARRSARGTGGVTGVNIGQS
jgi:hypothetical protein